MADTNNEMLSAGKVAAKLGASPAKIKKIIQELAIEPDMKKGACAYYGAEAQKENPGKIVSELTDSLLMPNKIPACETVEKVRTSQYNQTFLTTPNPLYIANQLTSRNLLY